MSYAPNESPSDLWLERSVLAGDVLGGVAYGIHVAVFATCIRHIFPRSLARGSRRSWFLVAFVAVLFSMGTLNLAANTRFTQLMFIDNRDFPGGPYAWLNANYSIGINTAGNAAYVIANLFVDGLLLWRTCAVYDTIWVVVFPFLIYLVSAAMSILTLFQVSRPDASLWTHTTTEFSLPYFSISISLNVLLTLLIVGRLVYMSKRAKHGVAGSEHAAAYRSVASMMVESAAPYAVTGLVFIITYARNSGVQNLVLPVLGQVMCISSELIVLRVVTQAHQIRPSYQDHTELRSQAGQSPSFQVSTPERKTSVLAASDTGYLSKETSSLEV